jgi:hypothetical protein
MGLSDISQVLEMDDILWVRVDISKTVKVAEKTFIWAHTHRFLLGVYFFSDPHRLMSES